MADIETLSPAIPTALAAKAAALMEVACDRGVSIATAESCTGGLLAALLTDVAGAAHAFDRGFVVYTEEAKSELLGVDRGAIDRYGAVSREIAIAMAEGALARSAAGAAIGITGFAGDGGPGDEAGLVHFACARRGGDTNHREVHLGDIGRGPVRIACLDVAIAMIVDAIRR